MRRSWPDLPGVAVWPWPRERPLSVRIDADAPSQSGAGLAQSIEEDWRRRCGENPKLYDGPILSVVRMEPGESIRVRRDSYKRLVVQPGISTGVEQLSVTGVVLSRDEYGVDRIFVGRRGTMTRMYGGMWELGPSGGIDPPPANRPMLGERDLVAQLVREFVEETGSTGPLTDVQARAICHDLNANSYDIVFSCRADGMKPAPAVNADRWEYDRAEWRHLMDIPAFDREFASEIIPPTRALFRFFGWT